MTAFVLDRPRFEVIGLIILEAALMRRIFSTSAIVVASCKKVVLKRRLPELPIQVKSCAIWASGGIISEVEACHMFGFRELWVFEIEM